MATYIRIIRRHQDIIQTYTAKANQRLEYFDRDATIDEEIQVGKNQDEEIEKPRPATKIEEALYNDRRVREEID